MLATMDPRVWGAAGGPELWGGVSRLDPGHTLRRLTAGKRSLRGGHVGSPEPPSLAQPGAGQPAFSGLQGCVASAPGPMRLRPGLGCLGAHTPKVIRAPELLIFLKRFAALTAMKFF